jgi:hypothetical protein
LLDGLNNPGFSGGPAISRDYNDPNRAFKVGAIISGFRGEVTPVSVNGQNAAGASVTTNTGIIFAVTHERVLALVKADKARNVVPKK